jgi:2-pyrone-4,6-dicarboxylate lactonase
VPDTSSDAQLLERHAAGIRGIRFNWVHHLLGKSALSEATRLANAAALLERVSSLGWHAEIHIDVDDMSLVRRLEVPSGMVIVIDHMARPDVASNGHQSQLQSLLGLLKHDFIWLKLSGADRVASRSGELQDALPLMRSIVQEASDRCVWGLDWPHVNLSKRSDDGELARLLLKVTDDESTLRKILIRNPEKLYGFSSQSTAGAHASP